MFKPASNPLKLLLCCAIIGAGLTSHALTDAWSVDANKHTAVQRTYKQGEYISAYVTLRDGYAPLDLTGATAKFLWYTNATDNLWWTNSATITSPSSGEITFDWQPTMDTGASLNYYWVGIWPAGSSNPLWRINGTIRLLPSPGFAPNTLPLPVQYLDFDAVNITNQPWATPADLTEAVAPLATTASVASVAATLTEVQAIASAASSLSITNASSLRHFDGLWWSSPTNYTDAAGDQWAISTTTNHGYRITEPLNATWDPSLQVGDTWWLYAQTTNLFDRSYYHHDSFNDLTYTYDDRWLPPQNYFNLLIAGVTMSSNSDDAQPNIVLAHSYDKQLYLTKVTEIIVTTNQVDALASTTDVAAAISAATVNFTDCLLYTSSGTNYYFRWSDTANTYIVTGVPQ